jgi:nucleoid-associated protein YgaU
MPVAPAPPPAAEITWTVGPGETVESICQKAYGLCSKAMVQTIENVNLNITDPQRLSPGQTLTLPVIENLRPVKP